MTPEQRKQAEISRSLATQHEAWCVTSAGQKGMPATGDLRPLAIGVASSVRATGPKGSTPTQVVVSQAASSAFLSCDPRAPGLLARAGLEAQKAPVRGRSGPEGVPGSSLVRPTVVVRPSFLSRDPLKQSTGPRVAGTVGQARGRGGGSKGSSNKSGDSSAGRE